MVDLQSLSASARFGHSVSQSMLEYLSPLPPLVLSTQESATLLPVAFYSLGRLDLEKSSHLGSRLNVMRKFIVCKVILNPEAWQWFRNHCLSRQHRGGQGFQIWLGKISWRTLNFFLVSWTVLFLPPTLKIQFSRSGEAMASVILKVSSSQFLANQGLGTPGVSDSELNLCSTFSF